MHFVVILPIFCFLMPLLIFQHVQAARWDAIANAAVRSGCGATCQQGKFDPKKTAHNDQPWKRRVEKCMLYYYIMLLSNLRANRACHNLRETQPGLPLGIQWRWKFQSNHQGSSNIFSDSTSTRTTFPQWLCQFLAYHGQFVGEPNMTISNHNQFPV